MGTDNNSSEDRVEPIIQENFHDRQDSSALFGVSTHNECTAAMLSAVKDVIRVDLCSGGARQ